ncbi:hypothetical protein GE061_018072 [Apolygus lucorum]|uniref:Uncharacterized protein n=1 Tax=Apolygus lucorum TaxID=248454 RepID=A0A8S9XFH5_APOLU|nr:hypothetical protein GE061_018072 [Apolygus lucorum]
MYRTFSMIFLAASLLYTSYGLSKDGMKDAHDELKSMASHNIQDKLEILAKLKRSFKVSDGNELLGEILPKLPKQSESTLIRQKRSLRGGSVSLRRKRAKQQVKRTAINFADMKSLLPVSQANNPFTPGYEQLGKREAKRPVDPRDEVSAVGESVDKKRSLFLANLLFMQSEQKMPQPLETLFTDSFM